MSTQKKTIKVFMFLLPALVTLLGYAAFHDMLFKEAPCLINCDKQSPFSDNEKLKKWLAFLESLRDNPFASSQSGNPPTALDLAFLQNKINTSNKRGNYFNRYRQTISDLTSPTIVEKANEEKTPPVHLAQLSTTDTISDTNSPIFSPDNPDPLFLVKPSPIVPQPIYLIPDEQLPDVKPPPIDIPKYPNPISNVPVPKAGYLLLALALTIVAIRYRFSQRM